MKIDYAKDILDSLDRAHDQYTKLERDMEELEVLWVDNWEDEEDKLEEALEKLYSDHVAYETKYLKMTRDHDNTIEQCKSMLAHSPNLKTRKPEEIHFYTIDNKKDNTLGEDTIGKEVLKSIGSVNDKNLENVPEATNNHNKTKISCEECNFETAKIKNKKQNKK